MKIPPYRKRAQRKAISTANIEFSELPIIKFQHEADRAACCRMASRKKCATFLCL